MIALADGTNKPGNFNQRTNIWKSALSRHVFWKKCLRFGRMAASRQKAQILIMSSWTVTTLLVPLIMLPPRHFQADPHNCRVILEKKKSLTPPAGRVQCPEVMWTMPFCAHSYKGMVHLQKEVHLTYAWKKCPVYPFRREFWKWAGGGPGRMLFIPNLLNSSRQNFCFWVLFPSESLAASPLGGCSCFWRNLC